MDGSSQAADNQMVSFHSLQLNKVEVMASGTRGGSRRRRWHSPQQHLWQRQRQVRLYPVGDSSSRGSGQAQQRCRRRRQQSKQLSSVAVVPPEVAALPDKLVDHGGVSLDPVTPDAVDHDGSWDPVTTDAVLKMTVSDDKAKVYSEGQLMQNAEVTSRRCTDVG